MITLYSVFLINFKLLVSSAALLTDFPVTRNGNPTVVPREVLEGSVAPGSYIVVLKPTVDASVTIASASASIDLKGIKWESIFEIGSFKGYEAKVTNETALEVLRQHSDVAYIVPNRIVTSANIRIPDYNALLTHSLSNVPSLWNRGRISHRSRGPHFNYVYSSIYNTKNCTNYAYLIDSGIYLGHSEFEGRAMFGTNTIGGDNTDGTGHGTHVAGIIAGKTFGVTKKTHVIAVKVLDSEGFGTYSSVIQGISWAVKNATSLSRLGVSVINMSFVGARNQAINDAARSAIEAGMPVVVAAGNNGELAVNYSPASERDALTVGASGITDQRPFWSNYGIKVDFFAPGEDIFSSYNAGPHSTAVISGTSMAAAHVSGLVNYLQCVLGVRHPRIIREKLEQLATVGAIADAGNTTRNRLIYNGSGQ